MASNPIWILSGWPASLSPRTPSAESERLGFRVQGLGFRV